LSGTLSPFSRGLIRRSPLPTGQSTLATSPASPDTVLNDRATKPREYAKAGVPLYLLVDQERAEWTLYALAEGWQRYQVAAAR
jgi:hypothetical protein